MMMRDSNNNTGYLRESSHLNDYQHRSHESGFTNTSHMNLGKTMSMSSSSVTNHDDIVFPKMIPANNNNLSLTNSNSHGCSTYSVDSVNGRFTTVAQSSGPSALGLAGGEMEMTEAK